MTLMIYISIILFVIMLAYSTAARQDKILHKRHSLLTFIQDNWSIIIISVIISIFSAGLSTEFLPDRKNYITEFLVKYPEYFSTIELILDANNEPGYIVFNLLLLRITDNPYWLFFIVSFFTSFINLYIMKKMSNKYRICVIIYFSSLFYFYGTYLLKQAIAVSITHIAFYYLIKGHKWKFFGLVAVACTFHITAIILIPAYFLFRLANRKFIYVVLFIGFIISFVSFGLIFESIFPKIPFIYKYVLSGELKLENWGSSARSFIKGTPYYLITLTALYKRKALQQTLKRAGFYVMSSVFYSISWVFTFNFYWSYRIGWYFMLPTILLLPELLKTFKSGRTKTIYIICIISLLAYFSIREIYITLY